MNKTLALTLAIGLLVFALGGTLLAKGVTDNPRLTVTLLTPEEGKVYNTTLVPVTFSYTSNWVYPGAPLYTFYLDGKSGSFDANKTGNVYTCLFDISEGPHYLSIGVDCYLDSMIPASIHNYSQVVQFTKTSISPSPNPTSTSTPVLTASLAESASALNFGNTINFTASADGGTKPYTYEWYIDNQSAQTNDSPYYSTNTLATGSHFVYVQVTDAGSNSAKTLTVSFEVLPITNLSPSSTEQPTIEPSQTPLVQNPDYTTLYIFLVIVTLTAIIVAGLTIYFKKYHTKKT